MYNTPQSSHRIKARTEPYNSYIAIHINTIEPYNSYKLLANNDLESNSTYAYTHNNYNVIIHSSTQSTAYVLSNNG